MNDLLKDKVAVITGGANGLGKATAFLFSEHGAKVVIVDVNQEAGKKVVTEIIKKCGIASFEKTDISKSTEVNTMMVNVVAKYGGVDILINNAGILADARLVKMTEEQWDRVININLKGIFLCGQAAAKAMIEKGNGGVILNPVLMSIEKRGYMMFKIWAKLILKKGTYGDPRREFRLRLFKYYLFAVIFLVSPIASGIFYLVHMINRKHTRKLIQYYSGISETSQ